MNCITFDTGIIGALRITEENNAISQIEFITEEIIPASSEVSDAKKDVFSPVLEKARIQIMEYLRGEREEFTFPITMNGTTFQEEVWTALLDIPYGETCSYKELAAMINNPKACRAVGMANNHNRLPIVIPCHRVIGADGRMIGYAGGIPIKKKLLSIERTHNLAKVFVRD
jgi:methylated-DNA-[protein]-cysteine S-methyltransferase